MQIIQLDLNQFVPMRFLKGNQMRKWGWV